MLLTDQDEPAEPVMPAADAPVALLSRAVNFRSAGASLGSATHADRGTSAHVVLIVANVRSQSASAGTNDGTARVAPIGSNVYDSFLTAR